MELTTIAKPYANAIFAIAKLNKSYSDWQRFLQAGKQLVNNTTIQAFIATPNISKRSKIEAIVKLLKLILNKVLTSQERAFLNLLLNNGRFAALPSILSLFESMINLSSDTKVFHIISAYPLSTEQKERIIADLSAKYQKIVSVDTKIDKNLVGGVIIKEGDRVIDLSIQARIDELGLRLSAIH